MFTTCHVSDVLGLDVHLSRVILSKPSEAGSAVTSILQKRKLKLDNSKGKQLHKTHNCTKNTYQVQGQDENRECSPPSACGILFPNNMV